MPRASIRHLVSFFFMASILSTGLPVLAAPPDNFTATMVSSGMEMPMAKMGTKSRVENPGMKGLVTITIADAKKTIMMNTANKTYYEQQTQDRGKAPDVYDPDMVFDKKKVGTETIDGHPCIKYDAIFYRKSKPEEKHKATLWEAQDLKDFAIQTEFSVPANQQLSGFRGQDGHEIQGYQVRRGEGLHVRSAAGLQEGQQHTGSDGHGRHGEYG